MSLNSSTGYYGEPYSLNSLSNEIRGGLIAIGVVASISLISTLYVIGRIVGRLVSWRKNYKQKIVEHQTVLLIFNLLLADLQQSLAFVLEFYWIQLNAILAPTATCWVQAGFLHIGDVASGFFVLSITLHTVYTMWTGTKLPYGVIIAIILGIWIFSLTLTLIGPLQHGADFFTRAGNWCWISQKYDYERLWLHYLWTFIDEFGTLAVYLGLFIYTLGHMRANRQFSIRPNNPLVKAAYYMCLYPLIYCSLTLPLAICRMVILSGGNVSNTALLISGVLLTSCGWSDAIIYTLTRHLLEKDGTSAPRPRTPYPNDRRSRRNHNSMEQDSNMDIELTAQVSGPLSIDVPTTASRASERGSIDDLDNEIAQYASNSLYGSRVSLTRESRTFS